MKPNDPIAAQLTWPQVHAFRLKRHHLTGRAKNRDLSQVVADIGGVQAQVMSAAELQVAIRVDCTVAEVREALWTDRTLVKTWLMRGTLHLARSEDLSIYCAAMSTRGLKVRPSWLKYFQLTEGELWNVVDEIGAALDGTPLTREELIAVVGKGKPARILESLRSGWGGMLKPAARDGMLCFGPSRGQSVTFVSPQKWLPSWRKVDRDSAFAEMARRYLRAYGPATKTDFARWWGAWPGVGNAAWSALGEEIVPVSVEGARLDALAADVDAIHRATVEDSVQLLPGFDPYVLGHASRDHLVDPAFASRVSRTAGWISAVVLVDGEAVGTWTHTMANEALRVTISPFRRLAPKVKTQVGIRAEELARAMSLKKTEVKFA